MFSIRQQMLLQVAAAAVIAFFIARNGRVDASVAAIWGAIVGLALFLLLRQNLRVAERARPSSRRGVPSFEPKVRPVHEITASEKVRMTAIDAREARVEPGHPPALGNKRSPNADDLKRIVGIGPKLEKLLNEMGIYRFEQIATWQPEDVTRIDQAIVGFRGRATRDKWVEQARKALEDHPE